MALLCQYIKSNSSYLYVLEQSEGSRRTQLSRYDSTTLEKKTIELLSYGGSRTSVWALPCYASVDGMAVSSDNVLCIGTTIDQSKYDNVANDSSIPHNIYLTVTPTSSFSEEATSLRYLTNYTGDGKSFLGVKITKITDDRFMIPGKNMNRTPRMMIPLPNIHPPMIPFPPAPFIICLLTEREIPSARNLPLPLLFLIVSRL